MTQTEQDTMFSRMSLACRQYCEAFDMMPERILVYFGQKPHLPPYIAVATLPPMTVALSELDMMQSRPIDVAHIPIEAYTPSKLNWDEFLLYSQKLGRVGPDDLRPGPTLITKMLEAKGYGVLVKTELVLDKFYIFQGDRYIKWVFSTLEYERAPLHVLKAELEYALKQFAN